MFQFEKSRKRRFQIYIALLIGFSILFAPHSKAADPIKGEGFCTEQEKWSVPETVGKKWASMIDDAQSSIEDYSKGLRIALQAKQAGKGFVKEWGEYWIWRSYLSLGLVHLAHRGFNKVIGQSGFEKDAKPSLVQRAALGCLVQLKREFPSLTVSNETLQKVLRWKRSEPAWQLITQVLLQKISDAAPKSDLQVYLDFLKGTGPYEAFAFGNWYAYLQRPVEAAKNFEFFLNLKTVPGILEDRQDYTKLILARQYHELKRYDDAIKMYSSVAQNSNFFAQALVEQSWSNLVKGDRSRAVGAAFGLGLGKVRDTFNPDAPVVMAISLFEICQFVESYRMVRLFKSVYEPVYQWLFDWNKKREKGQKGESLYQLAVDSLKGLVKVPEKVASEWARSPYFVTYQSELNLWYDEAKIAKRVLKYLNQKNANVSSRTKTELRTALGYFVKEIPSQQTRLVQKIEFELARLNGRMLKYLADTADNAQLVEVEIFNAASEGLLNPEDQPKAPIEVKRLAESSQSREWRFGRFPAANDKAARTAEVWDDEIDSLVADLKDRCPRTEKK